MATQAVTCTMSIPPPDPHDNVVVRTATVELFGGAIEIIVDLTSGTGSFSCHLGNDYSITVVDTNAIGDSPPSDPLQGLVAIGAIPAKPSGLSLKFE